MKWLFTGVLLTAAGTVAANPPQQAPRAQTTVKEYPGTPDRHFVQPGTPGIRITTTREEIPPPPATMEFLPRAAPTKVRYAEPAMIYRYAQVEPRFEVRYVQVPVAAPVYVVPAYTVYGKVPVAASYGPAGGLRTINYADGTQRRRGLVQRTVGFFIGD